MDMKSRVLQQNLIFSYYLRKVKYISYIPNIKPFTWTYAATALAFLNCSQKIEITQKLDSENTFHAGFSSEEFSREIICYVTLTIWSKKGIVNFKWFLNFILLNILVSSQKSSPMFSVSTSGKSAQKLL